MPERLAAARLSRGRPREFDVDRVLDQAMFIFQERGYHSTSVADLQAGMNLTSGSIYKAFKDKRGVFLAAFERYVARHEALLQEQMMLASSGRDGVRRVLGLYVSLSSGLEGRRGCLVVGSTAETLVLDAELARQVAEALYQNERFLTELIRRGQADHSVSLQIDPEATARLLLCALQGMRVLGKTGRTEAEMAAIVDAALKVLD